MSIIEKAVDKLSSEDSSLRKKSEPSIADQGSGVVTSTQTTSIQAKGEATVNVEQARPGTSGEGAAAVRTKEAIDQVSPPIVPSRNRPVDVSFSGLGLEGILASEGGRSRLDEEYRMIKRPLLVRALSEDDDPAVYLNSIMVCSALSGEGKTFTSMNLAISIAMEVDRTVLLVDSDLAKPTLSRTLGVSDKPGFTECLKDENLDLGDFLLYTDVPKLTVLPAGKRHNRATELLASNSMTIRLRELAKRYSDRIILFDSPPLLATSEASVLARRMGQIAIVVAYGDTPQFLVREAIGMLHTSERVSFILNKTRDDFLSKGAGGYGYGYGYGYGKGYGYGNYGDN
ncbi:MAG: AAA family ATPase [Gammaproteobacteria bacterium]|nr:AAA family ATPase [Gammaproteobacteria bacterium]